MQKQVSQRLTQRFQAYLDLVAEIDDDLLGEKVDVPKHKSLAEHLWCVVGARESYTRAIEAGAWQGFNCSMTAYAVSDFAAALTESAQAANEAIANVDEWDDERLALLATLTEHEVMHEGQIIRHMYALERTLPDSWVWA